MEGFFNALLAIVIGFIVFMMVGMFIGSFFISNATREMRSDFRKKLQQLEDKK